jgi:hypothetical protein
MDYGNADEIDIETKGGLRIFERHEGDQDSESDTSDEEIYPVTDECIELRERVDVVKLEKKTEYGHEYFLRTASRYLSMDIHDLAWIYPRYTKQLTTLCKIMLLLSVDEPLIQKSQKSEESGQLADMLSNITISHKTEFPVIEVNGFNMGTVTDMLEIYSRYKKHIALLDCLHRFRVKRMNPNTLSDAARKTLTFMGPPLIDHSTEGMDTNASIPLMSHMIRHSLKAVEKNSNWVVLVDTGRYINIYIGFPEELLESITEKIQTLDEKIERILLLLHVNLGPDPEKECHALCFLIAKINNKRRFVTILDGLWHHESFDEYNTIYMDRLIQLKDTLSHIVGWSNTEVLLSKACEEWRSEYGGIDSNDSDYGGQCVERDTMTKPYTKEKFGDYKSYDIRWLESMLETPIRYNKAGSKALMCTYGAALYVIGCIGEVVPYFNTTMYFDASYIFAISERLNHEFAVSILSGFVLLTPASIQGMLHNTGASNNTFFVIDSNANAPSDTYAMAMKTDDSDRVCVYSLKNDKMSDVSFEWEASVYTVNKENNVLTSLQNLLNGTPVVNDTDHPRRGRRTRENMEIDVYPRDPLRRKINNDPENPQNDPANALFVILKVLDKLILQ